MTVRPDSLVIEAGERERLEFKMPIDPGAFRLLYRTGRGRNAEWRFEGHAAEKAFLFIGGMQGQNEQFCSPFYQHYAHHLPEYRDDLFIKCDDDIIFIDHDRLSDFIVFRRAHRDYFIVSADVVNNGVCAHFQQRRGLVPEAMMHLEIPFKGLRGTLWESAAKTKMLHDHFVRNSPRFLKSPLGVTEWNERISINFIAFFGADFMHMGENMADDEGYLSYQGRWRSRKPNCIRTGLYVSHLSFYAQDKGLDIPKVLTGYEALAGGDA